MGTGNVFCSHQTEPKLSSQKSLVSFFITSLLLLVSCFILIIIPVTSLSQAHLSETNPFLKQVFEIHHPTTIFERPKISPVATKGILNYQVRDGQSSDNIGSSSSWSSSSGISERYNFHKQQQPATSIGHFLPLHETTTHWSHQQQSNDANQFFTPTSSDSTPTPVRVKIISSTFSNVTSPVLPSSTLSTVAKDVSLVPVSESPSYQQQYRSGVVNTFTPPSIDEEMLIDRSYQTPTTQSSASSSSASSASFASTPISTSASTSTSTSTSTSSDILSVSVSSQPTPSSSYQQQQQQVIDSHHDIHPLLIYSIRYEIRSYDLFPLIHRASSSSSPLSSSPLSSSPLSSSPVMQQQQQQPSSSTNNLDTDTHNQHGSRHAKTLIAGLKNTIGLDFYYSSPGENGDSFIFWIDVIEERIYRGIISNGSISNVAMVLQHGLATAEGLAVDWIGHNIYWVESTLDHIEVANLDGSSRRTLIAGDMDSPRAIALDPRYGLMFWSDWDKKNPRIERATMAGEDRQVLVNIKSFDGNWPNGITLDYDNLRVYWIDANSDSIHSIDYDGNNHQDILSNIRSLGHPFSITLFEDNVYWTDWKTNSVSMANKLNGSDSRELQRLTSRLFDIKVFHPNRQPKLQDQSMNPCAKNNGNCSHLCLLSTNHTRRCECPHLMKLNLMDEISCEPYERVLLIGKSTEIRAVDISEPLHNVMAPIGAPKVFSPRQIEFDSKSKTIFWVDSQTNEVKRAQLSSNGIDTIIDVIIESPTGLALDWISGNIYVTSAPTQQRGAQLGSGLSSSSSASSSAATAGKIFISNLNGEYISILMDGSASGGNLISPKSIAVHPILGLIFCIDESGTDSPLAEDSIIFMANMDGTDKTIVVSKANNHLLSNPTSLAIDYELNRLYWINQVTNDSYSSKSPYHQMNNSVQYLDIATLTIVTVIDGSGTDLSSNSQQQQQLLNKVNPSVLCVDGDNLIISGRSEGESIIKVPKHDISDASILINRNLNLDQVFALRVYNASSQVGNNSCSINNGDCSQLCVPMPNQQRVCKCTIGYSSPSAVSLTPGTAVAASSDNGSMQLSQRELEGQCVGKDRFLIYSSNYGMKGISLDLNSSPDDYLLPPIHRAFRASSIDYIYKDNLIYWVDNEEGSITRINRDTTNYQVIVQGLESEESIGIDWVAGNIYWLDPYYDIIEVARLNGSNRYVIASGEMDKANGIVVNPLKGYIVWSDVGAFPKIERAQMDGSQRKTLVNSHLVHIDDLAIDYQEDFIYWVDSTSALIERIKDDGTQRKVVYRSNYGGGFSLSKHHQQSHLISIAIYEDYLYVADSLNQGSIMRFDKNNAQPASASSDIIGRQSQMVFQSSSNLGDGIRDIAVFAPQPSAQNNPCSSNNGGCQDLCLFMGRPGEKRCICSHGKLKLDGLTCEPYDTFVLFSKLTQIDSLHIKGDESPNNAPYPPIVMNSRSSIISLTVDYAAKRVIYSEIAHDQICSVLFNGSDRRVLVEKQSLVEGISFAKDQLYWTSIQDNSISRLNTSSAGVLGKNCDEQTTGYCRLASVEKIVKLSPDDKPRGIAVDKCTSTIYWTNWNARNPSIQRANPERNYKVETIIDTQIKVPNGITIDHQLRRIYWCDARLDKIEYSDMNGLNRAVLIHALPQHPFALATWDNYVLWTDWLARGVYKADKFTGHQLSQIKKVVQRPMGIAVAAEEQLVCPTNDLCAHNNGGCEQNHTCIMHLYGEKECRPNEFVQHQDKPLPYRIHPKYVTSCRPGAPFCETTQRHFDFHDLLRDALDRFNQTSSSIFNLQPSTSTSSSISASGDIVGTKQTPEIDQSFSSQPAELAFNSNSSSTSTSVSDNQRTSQIRTNQASADSEHFEQQQQHRTNQVPRPINEIFLNKQQQQGTVHPPANTPPTSRQQQQQQQQQQPPPPQIGLGNKETGDRDYLSSTQEPKIHLISTTTSTVPSTTSTTSTTTTGATTAAITADYSTATTTLHNPITSLNSTGNSTDKQSSIPTTTTTTLPSTTTNVSSQTAQVPAVPCQIIPAALQTGTSTTDSSSGTGVNSAADCRSQIEFKCYLSEKLLCISSSKRCDGISDCPSKEDENDCPLSKRGSAYTLQRESNWHRYVTVMMIILAATLAALFLVFGAKGRRRRWFVGTNGAFNHRRMLDDNGTNIEISNPMFEEDDNNLLHCAFSIDLNERTTNFSNPLYERQFLLMNDKPPPPQPPVTSS